MVVLDDPLVSRFHARITVGPDGQVVLEDLQSANGVFINGLRLSRPSLALGDGDRFLIGTTEFSVFSLRSSAMVKLDPRNIAEPRTKAEQTAHPIAKLELGGEPPARPKRSIAVTGRSDAIHLVGQFAEQLMSSGHPLEAVRVLSEHLQNLMKGASAGLPVPTRILESATRYALTLQRWTQREVWIDYVFELHLASLQVPSETSLIELESALLVTEVDRALLGYFVTTLARRHESLTVDESQRLRRIERLGPPPSSKVPPLE
jgi:predicted component of type VI protein secretion system